MGKKLEFMYSVKTFMVRMVASSQFVSTNLRVLGSSGRCLPLILVHQDLTITCTQVNISYFLCMYGMTLDNGPENSCMVPSPLFYLILCCCGDSLAHMRLPHRRPLPIILC